MVLYQKSYVAIGIILGITLLNSEMIYADSQSELSGCKARVLSHYKQGVIEKITAQKRISDCHTRKKYSDKLVECKRLVITQLKKKEITPVEAKKGLKKCPDIALRFSQENMLTESQLEDIIVGKLDSISGKKALLVKTADGGFRRVDPGDPIYRGEQIKTGSSTAAEIDLKKGEKLFISKNTEFKIDKVSKGKSKSGDDSNVAPTTMMDLKKGKVRANVPKSKLPESEYKLLIRTKDFTLGVRGTQFVVESNDQKSKLNTLEGIVDVDKDVRSLNPKDSKKVGTGYEVAKSAKDSTIPEPKKFNRSKFETDYKNSDPEASKILEIDKSEKEEILRQENERIEKEKAENLPKVTTVPLGLDKPKPIRPRKKSKAVPSLVLDDNQKSPLVKEQGQAPAKIRTNEVENIYKFITGYADSQVNNSKNLDQVYLNVDSFAQKHLSKIKNDEQRAKLHTKIMIETKKKIAAAKATRGN